MPRRYVQLALAVVAAVVLAVAVRAVVTSARARRVVTAWMTCIECINGELNTVIAYGAPTLPILSQYVRFGAPLAEQQEVRDGENTAYRRLVSAGADTSRIHNLADLYVSNLIALYHVRSAIALRWIGGPTARQALDQALSQQLRPDVRTTLTALRDSTPP